ncbi:hypothetical protein HK098_002407 [Nowakowskiella sp. JEL0407]|nr:hypothetical protein HK098_002407 [Nowakowskiella sp. JEL0407]
MLNPDLNPNPSQFKIGSPIPPAFHLLLFPPRIPESQLASDGYEKEFSPPPPFSKRMWAGGNFTWNLNNPLKVQDNVKQILTITNAEKKPSVNGDFVLVRQSRELFNDGGLSMTEERDYVYLPIEKSSKSPRNLFPYSPASQRKFTPTKITLFRYSALTFNSHFIHYDPLYTRDVEGYPDCLVHGPLTCTLLLDHINRYISASNLKLSSFSYRAVSPLFVGQEVTLNLRLKSSSDSESVFDLWASNQEGNTVMYGKAICN